MTEILVFVPTSPAITPGAGPFKPATTTARFPASAKACRGRAIPTRDSDLKPLPLPDVERGVTTFLEFAAAHPHLTFRVTAVGCGLARFEPHDIAPMFRGAPPNCILPDRFNAVLQAK